MEKRAVLAAVLMALVFFIGQYFFFPATQETPTAAKPDAQQVSGTPEAPRPAARPEPPPRPETAGKDEQKPAPTAPAPAPRAQRPRPPQRLATVVTPLYRAVVSSEGGKLQELTLEYRGQKPMVILGELGPGGLVAGPPRPAQPLPMGVSATDLKPGPRPPTAARGPPGQIERLPR